MTCGMDGSGNAHNRCTDGRRHAVNLPRLPSSQTSPQTHSSLGQATHANVRRSARKKPKAKIAASLGNQVPLTDGRQRLDDLAIHCT